MKIVWLPCFFYGIDLFCSLIKLSTAPSWVFLCDFDLRSWLWKTFLKKKTQSFVRHRISAIFSMKIPEMDNWPQKTGVRRMLVALSASNLGHLILVARCCSFEALELGNQGMGHPAILATAWTLTFHRQTSILYCPTHQTVWFSRFGVFMQKRYHRKKRIGEI